MKNIEKYQNLISKGEVDALLLTSKHNRQYAAEYCIAEGVAVICKTQSYYFTDFRYIESAQKNLPGFAVKMVDTEHPYTKLINEAISDNTVKTIGFEDDTLTVEEYTLYNTKLNAVLHPYAAEINAPRASKEPWEIEYMKKAQEITDRTFDDLLNVIHPGMTEKELCAELIYRLYKYGSEGPYANMRNDKPMPAGAVVSAEPGIYIPDEFGVRIEDVTVLTENGCEILTKSPKNLIIL